MRALLTPDAAIFLRIVWQTSGRWTSRPKNAKSPRSKKPAKTSRAPSRSSASSCSSSKRLSPLRPPAPKADPGHSELDTLRTQTQSAQQASASASQQTAAMLSLNLKLQSSAAKNQARTIEHESLKIELREAHELLSILQVTFLPPAFSDSIIPFNPTSLFNEMNGYADEIVYSRTCRKRTQTRGTAQRRIATCSSSA